MQNDTLNEAKQNLNNGKRLSGKQLASYVQSLCLTDKVGHREFTEFYQSLDCKKAETDEIESKEALIERLQPEDKFLKGSFQGRLFVLIGSMFGKVLLMENVNVGELFMSKEEAPLKDYRVTALSRGPIADIPLPSPMDCAALKTLVSINELVKAIADAEEGVTPQQIFLRRTYGLGEERVRGYDAQSPQPLPEIMSDIVHATWARHFKSVPVRA